MKSREDRIRAADEKLLQRETYYRRARRVEIGAGVLFLLAMLAAKIGRPEMHATEFTMTSWLIVMFCFASAWTSDAKVKHIESVKLYRKEPGESQPEN